MDELFQNNSYSEFIVNKLKETSKILSLLNHWEDRWNFDIWAVNYDKEIRKKHKGLDFYRNYNLVLEKTVAQIIPHSGLT